MSSPEEQRLLERLFRRDEAAFSEFVRLYQDRVMRITLRMLGDRAEAEDVAQEVFESIFKAIGKFRGDSSLSTWVYRIAVNHCKNRIKYLRRRERVAHDDAQLESTQESSLQERPALPDETFAGRQLEQAVRQALEELDEDMLLVIVLRDFEQLSYEQIQHQTGLAEGTVKSRLHRARTTLAARVDELLRDKNEDKR